jgi:dipeptidyl-peptidase-4
VTGTGTRLTTAAMTSSSGAASSDANSTPFPVEDIVQHPLPGYVAPVSVSFSPDDKLISYLYSPTGTLSRQLFAFDPQTRQQKLLVSPPGSGVDEGNISTEEKLRRERLRERGLGITRYEWVKSGSVPRILVPLPGGVSLQSDSFILSKNRGQLCRYGVLYFFL